ncbi:hypothetical protein HN652_04835 [archaeon]|nr:hypothetical protein [archaeon]
MAKKAKSSKKSISAKKITKAGEPQKSPAKLMEQKLPPEMEKKLKAIKNKLDTFKEKVVDKFGDYIVGISLLPPEKQAPAKPGEKPVEQKPEDQKINVLVLVDDTTSKKMSKDELHKKFSTIVTQIGKEVDEKIKPESILLTDVWQSCYDGKFDLNKMIAVSSPIYDTGMLAAIKIAEVHKSMVIKKFEKYILSYVLAGSLVQGRATPESDIDVWIVIDDTDVKKMSRIELKDKLRAIILGMGMEAGEITGVKNKINIQVYILTDFWDSLKEANPIIFTLLRDGVPFYDRGIFMPWKQLLRMGKIKPSREAIDMFMSSGEQMIKRVQLKLRDIGMEDLFYATLTPSQAAIMLYGLPPPTPKETPEVLEDIFVKKEKMLEKKWIDILKRNVKVRKDLEHGSKKEVSGKELDEMFKDSEAFLKRIKQLFDEIHLRHDQRNVLHLYDEVMTIIRDVLKMEGVDKIQDEELIKIFENELISTAKVPAKYLRELNEIVEAKRKYDAKKLTKTEVEKAKKGSIKLIKFLVEYMQRKRGIELERAKIKIKHGEKFGEITLMDKEAFIIFDIDAKERQYSKAQINPDGSLGTTNPSNIEEFEKSLAKAKFPKRVFIKETIFEDIKRLFGNKAEVLLHY